MRKYSDHLYSPSRAMKSIGSNFWGKYRADLLAYAKDQTRSGIPERIHADWDGFFHWPCCTDKRIEWAVALFEHGDWPNLEQDGEGNPSPTSSSAKQANTPIPTEPDTPTQSKLSSQAQVSSRKKQPERKQAQTSQKKPTRTQATATTKAVVPAIEKKCSNCRFAKNPDRCGHGMFGPCEDWVKATKVEEYWPTWDDMKRAEYEDYRSRYREL